MPKLTDTQTIILSRAATRPDNLAMPLPEGLAGAAAKMAIGKMIERGWIEEVEANLRRGEALWRETGLLTALTDGLKPVFAALRLPGEAASVVLLRPLSGSAALAAVNDVIRQCGVDSRAARLACVISGASETVFFTASLYLGAADVKRARHAVPAALLAYAAGVLAAARLV